MASPWGAVDADMEVLGQGLMVMTPAFASELPAFSYEESMPPWSLEPMMAVGMAYSDAALFDLQWERPLKLETAGQVDDATQFIEPLDEAEAAAESDSSDSRALAVVPVQPHAGTSAEAADALAVFKRKSPSPTDEQGLSSNRLVKRRCRDKIDEHLQMLAESVPGCIERLSTKRRAFFSPRFPSFIALTRSMHSVPQSDPRERSRVRRQAAVNHFSLERADPPR